MKNEIANEIIDLLGIDIFENTRKREYSDARSLLVKILKDGWGCGWTEIANFFTERGKPMKSHASVIHLYKLFPMVMKENKEVATAYNEILRTFLSVTATENVVQRVRNMNDPKKFEKLEKCLDKMGI